MPDASETPGVLRDLLSEATAATGGESPSTPSDVLVPLAAIDEGSVVLVALGDPVAALTWFAALLELGLVPALAAGSTSRVRLAAIAEGIGARAVVRTGVGGQISVETGVPGPPARRSAGEVVILTSGTSGLATGVVHHLDRLLLNGRRHLESTGHLPDDRLLVSLPVHYSFALVAQVLGTVATGARVVFDGPPFSAARFAGVIARHKIDSASVTPALVPGLASLPDRSGSPRILTVGGSRLEWGLLDRLLDSTSADVFVTYGLTEAGPRVSTLAVRDEPPERWLSVGRPLPGVSVRAEVPCGVGPEAAPELVVDTDTRCVATLGPRTPLPDGPLWTGDLGRVEDGYVWVEGRRRDVAVVAGEKVRLPDLDAIAESLPGVHRARFELVGPPDDAEALTLTLSVAPEAPEDPQHYRRELGRLLRRVELPREVRVECGGAEWRK